MSHDEDEGLPEDGIHVDFPDVLAYPLSIRIGQGDLCQRVIYAKRLERDKMLLCFAKKADMTVGLLRRETIPSHVITSIKTNHEGAIIIETTSQGDTVEIHCEGGKTDRKTLLRWLQGLVGLVHVIFELEDRRDMAPDGAEDMMVFFFEDTQWKVRELEAQCRADGSGTLRVLKKADNVTTVKMCIELKEITAVIPDFISEQQGLTFDDKIIMGPIGFKIVCVDSNVYTFAARDPTRRNTWISYLETYAIPQHDMTKRKKTDQTKKKIEWVATVKSAVAKSKADALRDKELKDRELKNEVVPSTLELNTPAYETHLPDDFEIDDEGAEAILPLISELQPLRSACDLLGEGKAPPDMITVLRPSPAEAVSGAPNKSPSGRPRAATVTVAAMNRNTVMFSVPEKPGMAPPLAAARIQKLGRGYLYARRMLLAMSLEVHRCYEEATHDRRITLEREHHRDADYCGTMRHRICPEALQQRRQRYEVKKHQDALREEALAKACIAKNTERMRSKQKMQGQIATETAQQSEGLRKQWVQDHMRKSLNRIQQYDHQRLEIANTNTRHAQSSPPRNVSGRSSLSASPASPVTMAVARADSSSTPSLHRSLSPMSFSADRWRQHRPTHSSGSQLTPEQYQKYR